MKRRRAIGTQITRQVLNLRRGASVALRLLGLAVLPLALAIGLSPSSSRGDQHPAPSPAPRTPSAGPNSAPPSHTSGALPGPGERVQSEPVQADGADSDPEDDEDSGTVNVQFGTTACELKSFSLAKGEVVKGDRYFFGNRASIGGTLDGDLIAFANEAEIPGTVTADANMAGSKVDVSGSVGDDLRAFAGQVRVSGSVGGDFIAGAGEVRVLKDATIGGQTLVGGGQIVLDGTFMQDIHAGGGQVSFGGTAEGNVRVETDVLKFEDGAHIKGNLTYVAREELDMFKGDGAEGRKFVSGKVTFVPRAPKKRKEYGGFHWMWETWTFLGAFIVGCAIIALMRRPVGTILEAARTEPLKSLGFGFLGHIFVPFAALILIVLCITLPAGVLVLMLWAILFYLGKLVVSACIGDVVLRRLGRNPSPYLSLLLGMIPLWILFQVPILGSVLYWLAVPIFGIGASLIGARTYCLGGYTPKVPPPAPTTESAA